VLGATRWLKLPLMSSLLGKGAEVGGGEAARRSTNPILRRSPTPASFEGDDDDYVQDICTPTPPSASSSPYASSAGAAP
jgi:hypothetical protein